VETRHSRSHQWKPLGVVAGVCLLKLRDDAKRAPSGERDELSLKSA
jgi:hypothetical protein